MQRMWSSEERGRLGIGGEGGLGKKIMSSENGGEWMRKNVSG